MDTAAILDQAREVVANTFGLDPLQVPDTLLAADVPAWDSLHHFTLIATLEDRFGVTYSSDEIPALIGLQTIVATTARHLGVAA